MQSPYGLATECLDCPLRSSSFFCALSPAAVAALHAIKTPAIFPAAAVLFVEGQVPRGVYLLCQGEAKVSVTSREGKTLILRIAKPGEVLGIQAVLAGTIYRNTVETTQPSRLSFVARQDFLRFLNDHRDACLQVSRHMSRDCQDAYDVIRSIGLSRSVSARIAKFLLAAATGGQVSRGVVRARLELTHEDIAQLMGTSRESVTRTLSEWRKKDIADLSHSTLTIHDRPALKRLGAL